MCSTAKAAVMAPMVAAAAEVSGRQEGAPVLCTRGAGGGVAENSTVSNTQNRVDANQQKAAMTAPASDVKAGAGERLA